MAARHIPQTIESREGLDRIIEVLRETYGKVSHAAKKLGVSEYGMYQVIDRNPHIKDIIEDARRIGREGEIDDRELYIKEFSERYEGDATNGLKAAIYFLNTHGGSRGWGKDTPELSEEVAKLREVVQNKVGSPPKPVVE